MSLTSHAARGLRRLYRSVLAWARGGASRPRGRAGTARSAGASGALQAEHGLPAALDPLEPRMLLSANLLWSLADPSTGTQGGATFGYAVAADGNLTVVGAPYAGTTGAGRAYVFNSATGTLVATLVNPTPASGGRFGCSVAISGSTVAVGAWGDDTGATDSGSAYVFDAGTGSLLRTLNNPAPAAGDFFGISVSVSGSTLVVGAADDDAGAVDSGSAYVFDAGTGNLLRTLSNPTPAGGDRFGCSVAVSGATVVVGAGGDDTGGTDSGSAYVFDAATGNLLRTLSNPTPAAGDSFGQSVAVSGGTVVVGTPFDDAGATDSGSAYVLDAGTGNLVRTLHSPTPAAMDSFGFSVAVSGGTAVVGQYDGDDGGPGPSTGGAHVFDAATGNLLHTLNSPTPGYWDTFGYSVAVSGSTVAAGAPWDAADGANPGSAFTFDAASGNLLRTLVSPARVSGDRFGFAVAASGNTMVVGAPYDDTGGTDSGAAYVFDAPTGNLLWKLNNPTPAANDVFGYSVAISGSTVVVGAWGDNTGGAHCGAAYVFDAATGSLLRTLSDPAPAANDVFGYSVAVSGDTVVVGAAADDAGATDSGSVYVFSAATGGLLHTLNNPTPANYDYFGYSVAVAGGTLVVGGIYDSTGATNAGSAYIFDAATGALLHTLNNPTPANYDDFGCSVAVSGGTVVVGAINDGTGGANTGSAYVFDAATGALLGTLNNPTPANYDNFGNSVAVSGGTVVVGARYDDTVATDAGLAYVFDAGTGALLGTLNNPTPAYDDEFAFSVAVSAGTVVVGAPYDDGSSVDRGSAYVFRDNQAPVANPGGPYVLAVGADLVLDGSASFDPDQPYGDRIVSYAWDLDGDGQYDDATGPTPTLPWAQLAGMATYAGVPVSLRVTDSFGLSATAATTLSIPGNGDLLWTLFDPGASPQSGAGFGAVVAADGNLVVVGAPNASSQGISTAGCAYVFNSATGAQVATLVNPAPADYAYFGSCVAISGTTVVVGAYGPNPSATAAGTAFVFDAVTGNLLRMLSNPAPGGNTGFGTSVAISGNAIVVGAIWDDTGATDAGSAYIFDARTGDLLHALHNPAPGPLDYFGFSVAVSGDTVVVGAALDDTDGTESGSAYLFDAATGNLLCTLNNPTAAAGAYFGISVAASGSTVVVGAPGDTWTTRGGSAYVFGAPSGSLIRTVNNPTPAAYDDFGCSVAVSGRTVAVGANCDNTGATHAGSAYIFDAPTGLLTRTLNNPTPAAYENFGNSVAVSGGTVVVGALDDSTRAPQAGAAYVFVDKEPFASFTASPNPAAPMQAITFDASGSYDASPGHSIVRYCWDFDSDGVADAIGLTASHAYGQFGTYTATLYVIDDNTPQRAAMTTVVVHVDQGNQAPTARPGGPYALSVGADLVLDGSASSDPNTEWGDRIVSYAWDLDGDGQYDDAGGVAPTVPWAQLAAMPANTDLPVGLRVTDSLGVTGDAATTLRIAAPEVVGRYVFYNDSWWDGNNAAANAADAAAIATDKHALLPGQTATFANYTSYSSGINGIMIDVTDLPPGMPTAADFEFRVGNSNTPAAWPLLGVAPDISVSRGAGAGASDRITLIFPDEAVTKQWLRVKVLAGGAVGLASDDVFYFGNAVGEVGNVTTPQDAKVTTLDVSLTRSNLIAFPAPAPTIANVYDFNRDHKVNTMDVSLMRSNLTTAMNALKLITVPVEGALGVAAMGRGVTKDGFAKPQAAEAPALAMSTMDALAAGLPEPLGLLALPALTGLPHRAQ